MVLRMMSYLWGSGGEAARENFPASEAFSTVMFGCILLLFSPLGNDVVKAIYFLLHSMAAFEIYVSATCSVYSITMTAGSAYVSAIADHLVFGCSYYPYSLVLPFMEICSAYFSGLWRAQRSSFFLLAFFCACCMFCMYTLEKQNRIRFVLLRKLTDLGRNSESKCHQSR